MVNFSLSFKVAIKDLEKMGAAADVVLVHIAMYRVEDADCNLVKFTRLSGSRDAFIKTIDILSKSAGEYLTGLTDGAWKLVTAPPAHAQSADTEHGDDGQSVDEHDRIQQLYKKCFPSKADGGAPAADGMAVQQ